MLGRRLPLTTLLVSVEERDELIRLIRPAGPGPNTRRASRVRRIRLPSPVLKPGLARDVPVLTREQQPGL